MKDGQCNIEVLIPTTGREPELVARTLSSLAKCEGVRDRVRVLLIENGPEQHLTEMEKEYCDELDIVYMHTPRPNKSAALNYALEQIGDSLLLFLDDDVRLDASILRVYREAAERHPRRAYFGGPVEVDYEAAPPDWLLKYLPRSAKGFRLPYSEATHSPNSLFLGANWAAYAEDIKARGGFDPNRGPGSPTGATGQESAMQRELLELGCEPWYLPSAVLWHWVPESRCSTEWTIERAYRQAREQVLVAGADHALLKHPLRSMLRLRGRAIFRRAWPPHALTAEGRFKSEYHSSWDRGLVDGARLQSETNGGAEGGT